MAFRTVDFEVLVSDILHVMGNAIIHFPVHEP